MSSRTEREVFFEALTKKTPTERAAFLDRVCGEDKGLRERLEQLLACPMDDGFLENPLVDVRPDPAVAAMGPGGVIGRYRLLEKIGEGGMGLVYLAEQEVPLLRRVALKVIKWGMDTRAVLARFEAERQALALMDHPNIARVLDGGATETGRPYFVMEWIQGVSITEFCAKHPLPVEERLRLFLGVCDAVQHAHQKGIIHRDLKPSNVLVAIHDGVPTPKVIDFGVAKATNQRLTEKTLFTNFGTIIGTPAYMSPEQAEMSGLDIDTRSDIYSIGVLLYELLTGSQPFPEQRLRSVAHQEMQRILREEEPERPSTRFRRTTTTALPGTLAPAGARTIAHDLDAIVMKCLEKDRNRRYETANGLAADLRRHLQHEPISARPPSAAYRFQKLIRRHRVVSTAAALVVLSLILGIIVSTWALVRERASRAREQAALDQANQRLSAALGFVNQVVTNVAPEIRMVGGAAEAQKALLDAGLEFVQRLRQSSADDPASRVALARLLLYASERQSPGEPNTLGDYKWGLERAQEALQLLNDDMPHLDEVERLELLWQGHFATVQCLAGLGDWDETLRRSQELDPVLDQMERIPRLARMARRHRAMIQSDRGWVNILAGRYREALEQHLLPLLRSDWASSIQETNWNDELQIVIIARDNAGNACFFLEDFEAMVPHAAESLRISELLTQREPSNAFYLYIKAQCRAWHGLALLRTGNTQAGLGALRKARDEIESRTEKDLSSEAFRSNRMIIAAIQALAFAGWSEDSTVPLSKRRERVHEAERFLKDANAFASQVKAKSATLAAAQVQVPEAHKRLESDARTQAEP